MRAACKSECPAGTGHYAANQNQPADCTAEAPKKIALDSARREKELAPLIAQLALQEHAVHKGQSGDFLVCRWGMSKYCQDASALQDFARLVGAIS